MTIGQRFAWCCRCRFGPRLLQHFQQLPPPRVAVLNRVQQQHNYLAAALLLLPQSASLWLESIQTTITATSTNIPSEKSIVKEDTMSGTENLESAKHESAASGASKQASQVAAVDDGPDQRSAKKEGGYKRGRRKKRGKEGGGQQDGDSNGSKEKKAKFHTRGGGSLVDRPVHPGSYANPKMRELFDIQLPPETEEKETEEETKKEENSNADGAADKTVASPDGKVKRKVVCLVGYLGTGYGGFQINDGQRTIQGELELSLLRSQLIKRSNFGYPQKYSWSTSGRTDKGVHACAQVISAKIEFSPNKSLDDVRELINENLPEQIRILDVLRTTRAFCAHTQRDRVRYQYMIPSFALQDAGVTRDVFEKTCFVDGRPPQIVDNNWNEVLASEHKDAVRTQLNANYRVTPEKLDLLKQALQSYEGTHAFHNFSRRVGPKEARAVRYIISFRVEDPIVFTDENGVETEWIPTQVVGQSFLLNQIRKMVGMAMDVARGSASISDIPKALSKETETMRVSIAPAQGLYLDMSYYGGYNRRKQQQNTDLPDLDWVTDETCPVFKRWKDFRNGVVMKHVVEEEAREGNFMKYLFLEEFRHMLNGSLPEEENEEEEEAEGNKAKNESS